MYRRASFRVFQYDITTDGVTRRVERTSMIDYRRTLADARCNGHTMTIQYIGSYTWNE